LCFIVVNNRFSKLYLTLIYIFIIDTIIKTLKKSRSASEKDSKSAQRRAHNEHRWTSGDFCGSNAGISCWWITRINCSSRMRLLFTWMTVAKCSPKDQGVGTVFNYLRDEHQLPYAVVSTVLLILADFKC